MLILGVVFLMLAGVSGYHTPIEEVPPGPPPSTLPPWRTTVTDVLEDLARGPGHAQSVLLLSGSRTLSHSNPFTYYGGSSLACLLTGEGPCAHSEGSNDRINPLVHNNPIAIQWCTSNARCAPAYCPLFQCFL